jgi:hypothetical protein
VSALREGSVIYLDADAIVLEALDELWGGPEIRGCADDLQYCPFIIDKTRPWSGDTTLVNRCYINSGAFFAPAERYSFFERMRAASLDDDIWKRYTLDKLLYDNHFLCAFLNLFNEPVRLLDPQVYGWRGFLKGGELQVRRSGPHLVNRVSGKTLRLVLFAGVQQTPELLRSLPLDVSTLLFECIAGSAGSVDDALAKLYAAFSGHLATPPADPFVNDILRMLMAEVPRLAGAYTGQPGFRGKSSYFTEPDGIRAIAFAPPNPEITWNGLLCGGAYLDATEYSQLRSIVRALKIRKVFETGAGETSVLFRSLGIETYSLEYQRGPWSERAARLGCTCLLTPFDHTRRRFVDAELQEELKKHRLSDIDLLFIDSPVGTRNRENLVTQLLAYLRPRFVLYHDALRDAVNIYRDQTRYGWKLIHFFESPRGLALFAVSPNDAQASVPDELDATTKLSQPFIPVAVLLRDCPALKAGQRYFVRVKLTNMSRSTLSSRYVNPVHLSYHWLSRDGGVAIWDGLRTPLPFDLEPGDTAELPVEVLAPEREAECSLQVAVVQEGVAWFESASEEAFTRVAVAP